MARDLKDVEFRPIKGYKGYVIGEDSTVLKSNAIYPNQIPVNEKGEVQVVAPYYANRDNVTRINLFTEDGRKTPALHNLVADAFIFRKRGHLIICKNGDYRNCARSNLLQVKSGEARRFKRIMFGENRYNNLYRAFLEDPRPQTYYGLPIDVQEYIFDRGVVDWQPKILEFQ